MWRFGMRKTPTALYVLGAALALSGCAVSAVAADSPPSWRGTAGSTFQDWTFSTNARPAPPEAYSNPFGAPSAAIDYMPPWGSGWYNTLANVYGPAQGWWDISTGSITLGIINHPQLSVSTSKDIQVQVVYWDDISKAPSIAVTPTATLVNKTTALLASGPVGGAWYQDIWTFHVDANMNSEVIAVNGQASVGSQVDRVTVDTRYLAAIDNSGQLRTLPEGTVVQITGPAVSRAFDTFFYIENLDRAAGIRVDCASGQSPAPEGTSPIVTGILRVKDGERVIDQATWVPYAVGGVSPLAMPCSAVRSGLSPQGLLVRLAGRAEVSSPTATTFVVRDGAAQGVTVELRGGALPPANGANVAVTGVLGTNLQGPVLRAGLADSIATFE